MSIVISGVTAVDRFELEEQLPGADIKSADRDHGDADFGLFTIAVPLTVALIPVLRTWLQTRVGTTEIEIEDASGAVRYKYSGTRSKTAKQITEELEALRAGG